MKKESAQRIHRGIIGFLKIIFIVFAVFFWFFLLFVLLIWSIFGQSKDYDKIEDYHVIFDFVEETNKLNVSPKETLLTFGEYTYCSYLLPVPKESPVGLKEFSYHWSAGIDYDFYSFGFCYELSVEKYQIYKDGISSFEVTYGDVSQKPIYDDTHFYYPAYIFQWTHSVKEYVLLDDSNRTVVFVFLFDQELQGLSYDIEPREESEEELDAEYIKDSGSFAGFSIYKFELEIVSPYTQELYTSVQAVPLEELVYDVSWIV